MRTVLSEFTRGDLYLRYEKDEDGTVGFVLVPQSQKELLTEKDCAIEPLVQLYVRGDRMPPAFANGHTLCGAQSTAEMKFVCQQTEDDRIITLLSDGKGREATHTLLFNEAYRAVEIYTTFTNTTHAPLTLEMLSGASFGSLTPFEKGEAADTMEYYEALSDWSEEGRWICHTVEETNLGPSWSKHGVRVHKFGQCGSMPVRGHFPFLAVRDTVRNVTWALQIAHNASWQIELRRKDNGLAVTAGMADYDFGHWAKEIAPGKSFSTPSVYLTAGTGSAESVAQRILDLHERNRPKNLALPPIMFNEWCTSWGTPSHENMCKLVEVLRGNGMEYLVMDAGWYKNEKYDWSQMGGDWEPAEPLLYPEGMKKTVDMIRENGMVPGIWFEPETCGKFSKVREQTDYLLKRNGTVIDTDARRFLDMRKLAVQVYLDKKVIGMLQKYGFGYIKVDYNDCIGMGCDGAESLGEGLRQNMEAVKAFYRYLRNKIPSIIMENCSSGGHRLEPSMMELFDMASFSDAHECTSIPIIAANLHRLILPRQSQIWAVLHGTDSLRRLHYSLVNTYLGVMCLSGDVYSMNHAQWKVVERDIDFYKKVRHIIAEGTSRVMQEGITGYNQPHGWQAVIRRNKAGETLAVLHTFDGTLPQTVRLPIGSGQIVDAVCSEDNEIHVAGGMLCVEVKANFEAVAVYLK